jgi:hypothetical protein
LTGPAEILTGSPGGGHADQRKGANAVMTRYGFNLRTRSGQRVENISILAATQEEAERRLRQMYWHCEILGCRQAAAPARLEGLDVEAVIGLISRSAPLPGQALSALRPAARPTR